MGFAQNATTSPPGPLGGSKIDRALRTWPDADAEVLRDMLEQPERYTNTYIAELSNGEEPDFSESAVRRWRRDWRKRNGLR